MAIVIRRLICLVISRALACLLFCGTEPIAILFNHIGRHSMLSVYLPDWNSQGILPPILPGKGGTSPQRSPYQIDLFMLLDRFASSQERKHILEGFLNFRHMLHTLGITGGFQWLDGSFLENIELLTNRPPNDMDVVTFYELPTGIRQADLLKKADDKLEHDNLKERYSIDAYLCELGHPFDAGQARRLTYWYSMWSHRRDGLWKGFVQVDLAPTHDGKAREMLLTLGGRP